MNNLQLIQNGDYQSLRKNEASRWVANDILKKGNQYRSYGQLPGSYGAVSSQEPANNYSNFVKIP